MKLEAKMKFTYFLAIAVTFTAVIAAPVANSFDAEPQPAELNAREYDLVEPEVELDTRTADGGLSFEDRKSVV